MGVPGLPPYPDPVYIPPVSSRVQPTSDLSGVGSKLLIYAGNYADVRNTSDVVTRRNCPLRQTLLPSVSHQQWRVKRWDWVLLQRNGGSISHVLPSEEFGVDTSHHPLASDVTTPPNHFVVRYLENTDGMHRPPWKGVRRTPSASSCGR